MSDTTTTFADLGLPDGLLANLDELGFEAPTPIQAAAIPTLLSGKDLIGRARTGSGKTAAFGLPLLARVAASLQEEPGGDSIRALILAPTRELALQVTDALRQLGEGMGLSMLTVYGGASYTPQLRGLRRGAPIVVGTPGRLLDLLERGALQLGGVRVFVLDEADEMLQMGFIDDVERLLDQTPEGRQVALFSATMPPAIARIAEEKLRDPETVSVDGGRPATDHIAQRWMAVPQQHKAEALWRLLQADPDEATLVFCRTKAGCDEVVETMSRHGVDALALHGDLNQSAREQVLARLRDERVRVVVATDVAARGLDVEHLGHVVNFDLPDNAEVYTHRIGRTGRAGRAGKATTLVASSHWRRFLGMAQHLRADVDEIRPPSDGAIADAQRAALFAAITQDPEEASEFDAARLAVARRWIAEATEDGSMEVAELAALALIRLADVRGVALLADVERALPDWATDRAGPRNLRAGKLDRPNQGGGRERPERPERPQRGGHDHGGPDRGGYDDRGGQRGGYDDRGGQRGGYDDRGGQRGGYDAPSDEGHVELFLPVGENRRVTPADLVGAIASAADIPGRAIGKIRIHDKVSFVAMPEELAQQLLERVEALQIRGMKVAVLRARAPNDNGPRNERPRRGPPPGRGRRRG
ncbi:MAG: DEAD/DEAH box helicase [Deltaproteobacteria bacterium]|nr:DEAD/DEAH box helicase [Deltaproteobacteria bacterium]